MKCLLGEETLVVLPGGEETGEHRIFLVRTHSNHTVFLQQT